MSRVSRYHDSIRIVRNVSRDSRNFDSVGIGCSNAVFGGRYRDGHSLLAVRVCGWRSALLDGGVGPSCGVVITWVWGRGFAAGAALDCFVTYAIASVMLDLLLVTGRKKVYICWGIGGIREGGGSLTRRMSRRFCCSHRFCMCSCKDRIRLLDIRRLYDRSWCGHSIGHRPLGGGDEGLAFVWFIFSFQVVEGGREDGLLGPYIQNETPPLQSSFLVTVPS